MHLSHPAAPPPRTPWPDAVDHDRPRCVEAGSTDLVELAAGGGLWRIAGALQDRPVSGRVLAARVSADCTFAAGTILAGHAVVVRAPRDRCVFQLVLSGAQAHDGVRVGQDRVSVSWPGSGRTIHARGPVRWAAVSLGAAAAARLVPGAAVEAPGGIVLAPAPRAWAALARAVGAATSLAAADLAGSAGPAAWPRLERALLAALEGVARAPAVPASRHLATVRIAQNVIAAAAPGAARMPEVARQVGLSERALRQAFHGIYGMSPKRLTKLQALRRANEALRAAGPGGLVSGVAASLGLWEFGRFAVEYREVFGECPSETLARGEGRRRRPGLEA